MYPANICSHIGSRIGEGKRSPLSPLNRGRDGKDELVCLLGWETSSSSLSRRVKARADCTKACRVLKNHKLHTVESESEAASVDCQPRKLRLWRHVKTKFMPMAASFLQTAPRCRASCRAFRTTCRSSWLASTKAFTTEAPHCYPASSYAKFDTAKITLIFCCVAPRPRNGVIYQ